MSRLRGGGVLVRCVALFGEGDETYEISEATARRAAIRRETAEAQAMVAMHARGGKYTFHTTTEDCNVCAHCLENCCCPYYDDEEDLLVTVWKSNFYGAFVLNRRVDLHAIDATPARWRGDAGSSPLDRARSAASSPRNET